MYVDPVLGGDMQVTVNLSFYRVQCDLMTLDSIDAFGVYAHEVEEKTIKTRVDAVTLLPISSARPIVDHKKSTVAPTDPNNTTQAACPSCYGAEGFPGECCKSCEDVKMAYLRKGWQFDVDDISVTQCAEERLHMASILSVSEGCNIFARFRVARVTGNIHFIPGRVFHSLGRHLHDFTGRVVSQLNLSHVIHKLEFGQPFPGQANPLDGARQVLGATPGSQEPVSGRFSYFVKVVPTRFQKTGLLLAAGSSVESNQYSVTQHFTPREMKETKKGEKVHDIAPGVFITYDLSPIKVDVYRRHPYPSVVHFLMQLCAVCGGVLTVAGLLDTILYHTLRRWNRARAGKLI